MAVAAVAPRLVYRPQSAGSVPWEVPLSQTPLVDGVTALGFAGATGSPAIRPYSQIVAGIRMSVLAVGFPGISPVESLTSSPVLLTSDRVKMTGIRAFPHAAEMVQLKPIGDRANQSGVRETVNEDVSPSFTSPFSEYTVASDLGAVPSPASIWVRWDNSVIGEPIINRPYFSHAYIVPLRAVD